MRATCRLETGDLPGALADIEAAAQGAEDLSLIHGMRYRYWMKAGDPSKAQLELQAAKQINPTFHAP